MVRGVRFSFSDISLDDIVGFSLISDKTDLSISLIQSSLLFNIEPEEMLPVLRKKKNEKP